jgi:hypothetical protein
MGKVPLKCTTMFLIISLSERNVPSPVFIANSNCMIFSNSCEILQYNAFLGDSHACPDIILALFQINYHNLVKFDLDTDYLDAFQCVGSLILEEPCQLN